METRYASIVASTPEQHRDSTGSSTSKLYLFSSYDIVGSAKIRRSDAAYVLKKETFPRSLIISKMTPDWIRLSVRTSEEKFTSVTPNLGSYFDSAIILSRGTQDITVYNAPNHSFISIGIKREIIGDLLLQRPEMDNDAGHVTYRVSPEFRVRLIEKMELLLQQSGSENELNRQIRNCLNLTLDDAAQTEQLQSPDNRARIISLAIESIVNSGGKKISMQTLAENCHCSIRTLEYAFKDKLELGPKEFLSCFRLNCYREKIINNPTATLSDIAYDLEYKHLGNLAKNYRKLFGNLPSSSGAE